MLPNRKRELKNKFELNRRFSAKTKTAILPNHCYKHTTMESKTYAKDVLVALNLAKAIGESEEKVIADALDLFASSNPLITITKTISNRVLSGMEQRNKEFDVEILTQRGLNEKESEVSLRGKLVNIIRLNECGKNYRPVVSGGDSQSY